jgi:hypothetical protein
MTAHEAGTLASRELLEQEAPAAIADLLLIGSQAFPARPEPGRRTASDSQDQAVIMSCRIDDCVGLTGNPECELDLHTPSPADSLRLGNRPPQRRCWSGAHGVVSEGRVEPHGRALDL